MTTSAWIDGFDDDDEWQRGLETPLERIARVSAEGGDDETEPGRRRARREDEPPGYIGFVFAAGIISFVIAAGYGFYSGSTELIAALFVAPLLLMVTSPIAKRLAKADGQPWVSSLVMAACTAKLAGAIVRIETLDLFYGGKGDSVFYHKWGRYLAPHYRQGEINFYDAKFSGTPFIRRLVGWIYAGFGSNMVVGFLIFSWLSFIGLVFLWRAFKIAVPEGNVPRYTALILFYPSLLYWPSSIGKEAWMLMSIGIGAWGVARLLMHAKARGLIAIVAGIAGILCVRPHIGVLFIFGLLTSLIARRPGEKSPFTLVGTVIIVGVIIVGGLVILQSTEEFLGVQQLTTETVEDSIDDAEERTSQGGSEFQPVVVGGPQDLPAASFTVFFRPMPWEAHNAPAVLASLEGILLLGLCVKNWRSLKKVWPALRKNPYVAFCFGYIISFVWAFSAFSNFGILARQRVQVIPFFLVLLALDRAPSRPKHEREEREQLAELV